MTGDRLLYRTAEAAEILGLSKSILRELIARGEIQSLKIGYARRVSRDQLTAYVAKLEAAQAGDGPLVA